LNRFESSQTVRISVSATMIGFLARRTLPRASSQLARIQTFPISSRFFLRSGSLTSRWISSTAPTSASAGSSPVSDKKLSVTATSETTRSDEVRHGLSSRRVVAVCTAAQYDLRKIDELFHGPTRAVHRTLPYVHVVNPLLREEDRSMGQIDIFFFPHGSFVAWGTTPAQDAQILEKLASLRGPGQHAAAEREEYTYFVSNNNQNDIDIKRDALVLAAEDAHIKVLACTMVCCQVSNSWLTFVNCVSQVAFSFGLAGSVKLNVLEEAVDHLMSMTPVMITKHTLAESQIERQLNQLYEVRKANLTILDLPDYFWEHPQHEKVRLFLNRMILHHPLIRSCGFSVGRCWKWHTRTA
jgi:uncharacterized Rmd1/YagE family protein